MRWSLLISFSVCLAACEGDYGFTTPSCDADVAALDRNLFFHLQQGEWTGNFAYEPSGVFLDTVSGSYDTVTGDFEWVQIGSDNAWLTQATVKGYGYANPNGDLDIIGESNAEDVLGVTTKSQFRIERFGCQNESSLRYFSSLVERERVESGTYSGTQYDYTQVTDIDGVDYTVTGTRWTDTSYEQDFSFTSDTQTYSGTETGSVQDRTSSQSYTQSYSTREGPVERVGTIVTGPDGSSERGYVQTSVNGRTEWTYSLDYAGNGSGTVTGEGFSCELTYQNDNCTFRCPSGQTGNC